MAPGRKSMAPGRKSGAPGQIQKTAVRQSMASAAVRQSVYQGRPSGPSTVLCALRACMAHSPENMAPVCESAAPWRKSVAPGGKSMAPERNSRAPGHQRMASAAAGYSVYGRRPSSLIEVPQLH